MPPMCQFCRVEHAISPNNIFCELCIPEECPSCKTNIEFNEIDRIWVCENDHLYTAQTMLEQKYKNRREKYNTKELIKFGGPRTEAIIQDPTTITEIAHTPDELNRNSEEIVLHHGTRPENAKEIISEGRLKKPSELGREDELNPSYKGSFRYDAVFGWPFTEKAGPNDYEFSTIIYYTAPKENVTISTYSYLETFQYGYCSLKEYEDKYCFTVDEFLSVCKTEGRPYSKNELLQFTI